MSTQAHLFWAVSWHFARRQSRRWKCVAIQSWPSDASPKWKRWALITVCPSEVTTVEVTAVPQPVCSTDRLAVRWTGGMSPRTTWTPGIRSDCRTSATGTRSAGKTRRQGDGILSTSTCKDCIINETDMTGMTRTTDFWHINLHWFWSLRSGTQHF